VISPLSALGLSLAMASDTPTASQDYPAKIIVAWEKDKAVIERPFLSQKQRYYRLTGVPFRRESGGGNSLVYRAPGQYLTIVAEDYLFSPPRCHFYIKPNQHFCVESTPRILWFLNHFIGPNDDDYISNLGRLCLGIPFPIATEIVPANLSFYETVVRILESNPCNLRHLVLHHPHLSDFTIDWEDMVHDVPFLTNRNKLFNAGHLYLAIRFSMLASIHFEAGDFPCSRHGWDENPFKNVIFKVEDKSVVEHLLQTGILELNNDYDARIKRMIEEGTPDYMDGYESMATLIDKRQGISWLPEDEFEEIFRTYP
jgi:hypothetical protein